MPQNTQKEVHVAPDLTTSIYDVPIPKPGPYELLIKNHTFSINPKDWKIPLRLTSMLPPHLNRTPNNTGDDLAGTIISVGSQVRGFHSGDRVAGFHVMGNPNGSFAEYSIVPEWSAIHLGPDPSEGGIAFEAGATLTLALYTAAVGLYHVLGYREPWALKEGKPKQWPVVIWGGSTTVGAYAIKFAKASGLGPIITLAGKGQAFVKTLIDEDDGDVVVDYRRDDAVQEVQRIAREKGLKIDKVFDCVSENGVAARAGSIFEEETEGTLAIVNFLSKEEMEQIPKRAKVTNVSVGSVHPGQGYAEVMGGAKGEGAKELARAVGVWVAAAVRDGRFKTHPTKYVEGGLNRVDWGLHALKNGEVSAEKLIYKVEDTF